MTQSGFVSTAIYCCFSHLCLRSGARCSSVVRAFAHGAMGRRIDLSWGEPTELFLVPASEIKYFSLSLSVSGDELYQAERG